MEQTPILVKISNLQNVTGLLAHALHTGIKPSVEHQLTRVKECVLDIVNEGGFKPQHWRNLHKPQEVFIDPESVHAFMKLQSSIAAMIQASYLNDSRTLLHTLQDIDRLINYIGVQYSFNISLD